MKTILKIFGALLGAIAILAGGICYEFARKSAAHFDRPAFSIHDEVVHGDVAAGKRIYMVRNGCVDCHGENLAGKVVVDSPAMGTLAGANLTPFELKTWSDEEIAGAIRYGIHKDGRSIRFMPVTDFVGLSKSDVASVIAYLRSVPEVPVPSHENTYGPVPRIMAALGKMPVMFPAFEIDRTLGFTEKPPEVVSVAFGKYLASACVGCHGEGFQGGQIPGGDPAWPKASDIRFGADSFWTESKFQQMIATGNSQRTGQPLRFPMPVHLLKQMNEMEVRSLWIFLSSVK